jgi:hypothetical protein
MVKKIQTNHLSLLQLIIESTNKGKVKFNLESKFIGDKVIAKFLGQYNEWRYKNQIGCLTEKNSAILSRKSQARLNLTNGEIEVGTRSLLFSIAQTWTYFIVILLSTFALKKPSQMKYKFIYSLTKEQIYKNGDVKEFSEFIRQERFTFNQKGNEDVYLIECRKKPLFRSNTVDVIITRDIPLYVYRNNLLFQDKIRVLVESLKSAIRLTTMLPIYNWLFLFTKEIIIEEPIFRLVDNSSGLEYKLITTQSHLFSRPLPFYRGSDFDKTMIWYSSNTRQINRKGDEFEDFERSLFETLEIDVHYVWSQAQADFIRDRNSRQISTKIVGSIVFLPIRKPENRNFDPNSLQITYFDVTPTSIWYHQDGFYSEANMASILMSMTKVVEEIENELSMEILLGLKPKRRFKKGHHSDEYKSLVDSLASSGRIEIIDSKIDLYDLVNRSDLVIAVPFSSPCLVAHEMGVSTAYFSTNSDFNVENPEREINLLLSERDLRQFILSSLRSTAH